MIGIYELSFITDGSRQPSLDDYMAHLLHALDVAGEDHVAIGSDTSPITFDTLPDIMKAWYAEIERRKRTGISAPGEGPSPFVTELNRPDRMEPIGRALARKRYGSSAIAKVLGTNFQRVFAETWRSA